MTTKSSISPIRSLLGIVALAWLLTQTALADISGNPEKIAGWVVAYEIDASGSVSRGSLARLLKAIRSGADMKLGLDLDTTPSDVITCDRARIFLVSGVEHAACETTTTVAHVLNVDPNITQRNPPYISYQWFDTLGRLASSRASIFGGANVGQTVGDIGPRQVTWFARVR